MSTIGFDSCFYDRLDRFCRSLNHVLLSANSKNSLANEDDWRQTLELVQTFVAQRGHSLAASSVAACLKGRPDITVKWDVVAQAIESRNLDQATNKTLRMLAWSLDEERTAVLVRMRQGYA